MSLPKMLDAAFLFGEKRFQKKMNKYQDDRYISKQQSPSTDRSIEDVLNQNIDPREKIEKLVSDNNLQRDFLIKANRVNENLQPYFYLPLLYIFLDPPSQQHFDTIDIEQIFSNFGQILKVINKNQVIYVLMRSLVEAWIAVKTLNNTQIEQVTKFGVQQHTLRVQLCFEDASNHHIYQFNHQDFTKEAFIIEHTEDLFEKLEVNFKFVSIFEIDVDIYQQEFDVKNRILGLKASNVVRILYLVEKAFAFDNSNKVPIANELDIKLLIGNNKENQLILMGNSWDKFQLAQKYANELFAQIKEEFKFFQDYQLIGLKEARVKRTDKFFQKIEIQYQVDD